MKKLIIFGFILFILSGCNRVDIPKTEVEPEPESEVTVIVPEGDSLQYRINTPEGYIRRQQEGFTDFIRSYKMKPDGSPVLLYDGSEKGNQSAHAAVFDMPVVGGDLQQCADSVMRMYAEYYWQSGQYEKIAFHFTDGFLCEYTKWREGYRVSFPNGKTVWNKATAYDASYENFEKYLRMVFSYAGTASMDRYESETISLSELDVGDVILKGGSPGHVVMVADVCENNEGDRAFLLAQGYMPAQDFHIINNPEHMENPWYYESEFEFPLHTPEYTFENEDMLKRLSYKG